jgi:hypothetical protein
MFTLFAQANAQGPLLISTSLVVSERSEDTNA